MEKVLIDTDIIIDFLRGYKVRLKTLFQEIQEGQIKAFISLVSITELYSGQEINKEAKRESLEKILAFFQIVSLDLSIAQNAGRLRWKYGLGLADALIAATSLSEKIALFTFNQKHFQKIKKLKLYKIQ